VKLGGAAVCHASHRQHCIAMSSTEAELMALAECALEVLYARDVLSDLGHVFDREPELATSKPEAMRLATRAREVVHGPTEVGTDNSGAFNLCQRESRGKHSRHIERKFFKMRELRREGAVKLVLIPTDEMEADMFTKALSDKVLHRHRRTVMNLGADKKG
jgi:hypothetical protein